MPHIVLEMAQFYFMSHVFEEMIKIDAEIALNVYLNFFKLPNIIYLNSPDLFKLMGGEGKGVGISEILVEEM